MMKTLEEEEVSLVGSGYGEMKLAVLVEDLKDLPTRDDGSLGISAEVVLKEAEDELDEEVDVEMLVMESEQGQENEQGEQEHREEKGEGSGSEDEEEMEEGWCVGERYIVEDIV